MATPTLLCYYCNKAILLSRKRAASDARGRGFLAVVVRNDDDDDTTLQTHNAITRSYQALAGTRKRKETTFRVSNIAPTYRSPPACPTQLPPTSLGSSPPAPESSPSWIFLPRRLRSCGGSLYVLPLRTGRACDVPGS